MGSTGSKPSLCKVAPCNGLQEERREKRQWTLPGLPVTLEQPAGSLGQKKATLPPLKQEITLATLSGNKPCFAGGSPQKQHSNSSIIHSHPPQRPKALQPLAPQAGHASTASHITAGRNYRDGGVYRFSAAGQTGHYGTSRMIQGGFLEAQTALPQQAQRHRQAQLRQAREQRRHKTVHTVNVRDPNTDGTQRMKLVRRPTERYIFWDETTRENLDPSCLLEPESLHLLHQHRPSKT